jgi:nucleoside-diphosphate-sugar epimerase
LWRTVEDVAAVRMDALLIGGTGPTGPHIAEGLLRRGYDVTVLHRGTHEAAELPDIPHIHADPHFEDTIRSALSGRSFDVVVSTYGRTRHQAKVLAGRCRHFLGIGGTPAYVGRSDAAAACPGGMKLLAREEDELASAAGSGTAAARFAAQVVETEVACMSLAERGAFLLTWLRLPQIYGPRSPNPREWSVVKRVLDKRPFIIVPDNGLAVQSRVAARNAAHAVLLAIDQPERAGNRVYNVADGLQLSLRQWVEMVASVCEGRIEIVSLPFELAVPARDLVRLGGAYSPHDLIDASRIRAELGYQDHQTVHDGLAETITWQRRNPVSPGAYPSFMDTFDYAREDALTRAYRRAAKEVAAAVDWPDEEPVKHSYAHPVAPGLRVDHHGR